jgi:hypothetical protein
MGIVFFIFAIFIIPIAIPAWAIEGLIRRKKANWEFNTFTAIPYFLVLTCLSVILLVSSQFGYQLLGLYISISMFLLSFCLSIVVLIGTESRLLKAIQKYADRKYKYVKTTFTTGGIVRGISGFFIAIHAYGSIFYFIKKKYANNVLGIDSSDDILNFFDCIYFSFSNITTLGSDIKPLSILTKLITVSEVCVGIFYLVFFVWCNDFITY